MSEPAGAGPSRSARRWMAAVWPAFLMAGVLEALVFSVLDPQDLHGLSGVAVEMPRAAVYTLAFGVFWLAIALAAWLALWLDAPPTQQHDKALR